MDVMARDVFLRRAACPTVQPGVLGFVSRVVLKISRWSQMFGRNGRLAIETEAAPCLKTTGQRRVLQVEPKHFVLTSPAGVSTFSTTI